MTYRELIDHVLDLGSEDTGSDFEDMVKVVINLVYKELLEEVDQDLERREFTLTTVAGRSKYGFPVYVNSVENIEDPTDDIQLEMITRAEYDRSYAGQDDTGPPYRAYPFGKFGVERHPTETSALKIVSTSALDKSGGDYSIVIRGFSGGTLVRESIDFNGTTVKTTTNTFDADHGIERLVLVNNSSTTFAGIVSVKDADISSQIHFTTTTPTSTVFASDTSALSSTNDIYNGKTITFTNGENNAETQTITDYDGSTKTFTVGTAFTAAPSDNDTFTVDGWTLATIPPYFGDSPTYQWYEFFPIPDDKRDLTVRAIMTKAPLINDDDWPEIPEEYHDLLIYGAAAALMGVVGKPGMGDRMTSKYSQRLGKFTGKTQNRRGISRTFGNVTQIVIPTDNPGRGRFPYNVGL